MMLVFYRAVSFPLWLGIFARESRSQFQPRSSHAPTTHTPSRYPSSSLEKGCRSSLRRSARHCEKRRNADAAADLCPSFGTPPAFREILIPLSSPTHRDQQSLVLLDRQRIRVPPRSDYVPAIDRNR